MRRTAASAADRSPGRSARSAASRPTSAPAGAAAQPRCPLLRAGRPYSSPSNAHPPSVSACDRGRLLHCLCTVAHRDLRRYALDMNLRHHGRYDYVPLRGRRDYGWPGGKRLAVYFALNLEHFSFGEGLGAELAAGGPQPDVLNYAWRDYGNRAGAWYLQDAFDALDLPMAALVNSHMYDYAPSLIAAHRKRGDEIVG